MKQLNPRGCAVKRCSGSRGVICECVLVRGDNWSEGNYNIPRYRCNGCVGRQNKHHRKTPQGRAMALLHAAKGRCRDKGGTFTLTLDRIKDAIDAGVCEYTGLKFNMGAYGGQPHQFSPSVDRIDSSDPDYSDDKVQIVVDIHNKARNGYIQANEAVWLYAKAIINRRNRNVE